ncbi:DUF461 domain-containing protein [Streptomyces sp. PKU-EA00015]|uniref:DUF461 domain-containing protein n=1 Tax=Streptomyces sp. PKU-EA00015 TaxID=2748326 RepID=UPI0015A0FF04|nr:DUF461 domain-containing protein [Streptomyces sp. PKU-EA00015]NWF27765.1 DUF461 domain-containing protein [Streptomyces sp. PKU-EA00015]
MSSSLRRGALAGAAIVFSIASLSACGAGNDAQTLGVRPDNAATAVDDLKLQNATVITQPEGAAAVSVTVFNEGTQKQTLDSITLPGSDAKVALKAAQGSGPITVPAGGSVIIGGKGNASAVIAGGHEAVRNGDTQEVVFRFSETGDVKMVTFVVPATGYYAGFGPSSSPKPTAEQPAAPSPSGSPAGSPSGSPAVSDQQREAAGGEAASPSDSASASHGSGH